MKICFLAAFPVGLFSQLKLKVTTPSYMPYHLGLGTHQELSILYPRQKPQLFILTVGKTQVGYEAQEEKEMSECNA